MKLNCEEHSPKPKLKKHKMSSALFLPCCRERPASSRQPWPPPRSNSPGCHLGTQDPHVLKRGTTLRDFQN